MLSWVVGEDDVLNADFMTTGSYNLSLLVQVLVWFLASMLLGPVMIMIGSFGGHGKFGELAKARRATKVGKTGNTLLAEMLRDANLKYEIASGFFGLLLFGGFLLALGWFSGTLQPTQGPTNPSEQMGWLSRAFAAMLSLLLSALIRHSASDTIVAIDQVLEDLERHDEPKQKAVKPTRQSLHLEEKEK